MTTWIKTGVSTALTLAMLALAGPGGSPAAAKGKPGGGGGGGEPPPDAAILFETIGNRTDIRKMDADGGNDTLIFRNVPGYTPHACWSPDASQIAIKADFAGAGIYVADADGGNLSMVATLQSTYMEGPAWAPGPSPDGETWIVFSDDGLNGPPLSGNRDLFCVRPDGSGRFNLTNTPDVSENDYAWSPEADRLVVLASHHDDVGDWVEDLYVLELGLDAGSLAIVGETCLTDDPLSPLGDGAQLGGPDWAKTQDLIAVRATVSGQVDIWVIDLAAPANPTNLTEFQSGNCMRPTWSPDDSQIAYKRVNEGTDGIYVMNADGTNVQLLRGGARGPDWKR